MGSFELVDTHSHLAFNELRTRLSEIISNAKESNLCKIVNIALGKTKEEIEAQIDLSKDNPMVVHTLGVHPGDASEFDLAELERIESLIKSRPIRAIGEVGLDFHYPGFNREKQEAVFRKFLRIAISNKLPAVIHQRDAFERAVQILAEENLSGKTPFVLHCFGGTQEEAQKILDMGGMISLTGIITFKKTRDLCEVVKQIPLSKLMLETDAPFLAPEPKRGKVNEPSYVLYIAKKVAELKNLPFEEVANVTTANAKNFFNF
jgi:TatD DNase family protein